MPVVVPDEVAGNSAGRTQTSRNAKKIVGKRSLEDYKITHHRGQKSLKTKSEVGEGRAQSPASQAW
jgi:hypothetical protein